MKYKNLISFQEREQKKPIKKYFSIFKIYKGLTYKTTDKKQKATSYACGFLKN